MSASKVSRTAANRYRNLVEEVTAMPWREGNAVKILQNGDEIFPAMLEAIQSAKSTVDFLSFVFWRSDIATEFTKALADRAKAGVRVRVLVDAFGGAKMSSRAIWHLERAGVTLGWYHPGRWQYVRLLNNRTHRKLLLIDGRIGFTGGVGIADEWTGSAQDKRHFRETHCRIEGPAVADLQAGFDDNWPTDSDLHNIPVPLEAGGLAVNTLIASAGHRPTAAQTFMNAMLSHAHEKLWITSAYFVPGPQIIGALRTAAHRGVDVRILTNGENSNHRFTTAAGRATYRHLLSAGVRIYEYQRTTHHGKVITADGAWGTIGSINLDARSLYLNDELNISVIDQDIVASLDQAFLNDLTASKEIKAPAWRKRSPLARVIESSASLFSSQL